MSTIVALVVNNQEPAGPYARRVALHLFGHVGINKPPIRPYGSSAHFTYSVLPVAPRRSGLKTLSPLSILRCLQQAGRGNCSDETMRCWHSSSQCQ